MGAFFTNIQIRSRDLARIREVILAELRGAGMRETEGNTFDRELLVVPGPTWTAVYDLEAESQGATASEWARAFSAALATDAFSVLVHDSDVLDLALFGAGKQRDHYDSNPAFSGKKPSKVTPAARAAKWSRLLAAGRGVEDLAAVFADRSVFAEAALEPLAAALGIEHALLATGYNYLTREGVPASAIRVRGVRTKRPAWERRLEGPPRFVSQWERHGMEPPEQPPQAFLEGQPVHATAQLTNQGGAAKGLRIEIAATGDSIELDRIEVVIQLPGKFQMARYPSPLVRAGDHLVAELPDVALMPGAPAGLPLHGAPMDAMMDAHHAGDIHLNLHGRTRRAGRTELAIRCIPLANPTAGYVAPVAVDVQPVRGAPLRARGELYPHLLAPLTGDDHTYLLVVFDARAADARTHVMRVLDALRPVWPKGAWEVFASDERFEHSTHVKARGDLRDLKVWNVLAKAIASAKCSVTATCGESSGFDVQLETELPQLALALAKSKVSHARAAEILIPIVDALAKDGAVVQAVLARWQVDGLPSGTTPYESVVGIDDDEYAARRAWSSRWVRAVGRGQLWLGPALADRASALPLTGTIALGPARRIPIDDVAAAEQILAPLLPSGEDFHDFIRTVEE